MVRNEFAVHRLNEEGLAKADRIAQAFTALLETVEGETLPSRPESTVPESGRCLAIVRTKLQEASFFAKRAMAVQLANQIVEPEQDS